MKLTEICVNQTPFKRLTKDTIDLKYDCNNCIYGKKKCDYYNPIKYRK